MAQLFLLATLGTDEIAVNASQIDGVVDIGTVLPVPRADPAIRGLAALRSRIATVIDTRRLLGLDPAAATAKRAVTAMVDGHLYAFLVDTLEDVAPCELRPLTGALALAEGWRLAAAGLVERDGQPLLVVDLAALVTSTPALAA